MDKKKVLSRGPALGLLCGMAMLMTGCDKSPDTYSILPSQTGFLISSQGGSGQAKFKSSDYLRKNQVPYQQVTIQYHGIGNNNLGNNYYPDALLVLVDRSSLTRYWTSNATTGTDKTDQSFLAQSADGIAFHVDANCTAQITEQSAADYLFNYSSSIAGHSTSQGQTSGNPSEIEVSSLPYVMDNVVRGRLQDDLTALYNPMQFNDIRKESSVQFRKAVQEVTAFFGPRGIEISSCGLQGGPSAVNQAVTDALNSAFASQADTFKAEAQATAQAVRNKTNITVADAQATAQTTTNNVALNNLAQQGKELAQYPTLPALIQAQRSNGQGPLYIGGNGNTPSILLPAPTAHP